MAAPPEALLVRATSITTEPTEFDYILVDKDKRFLEAIPREGTISSVNITVPRTGVDYPVKRLLFLNGEIITHHGIAYTLVLKLREVGARASSPEEFSALEPVEGEDLFVTHLRHALQASKIDIDSTKAHPVSPDSVYHIITAHTSRGPLKYFVKSYTKRAEYVSEAKINHKLREWQNKPGHPQCLLVADADFSFIENGRKYYFIVVPFVDGFQIDQLKGDELNIREVITGLTVLLEFYRDTQETRPLHLDDPTEIRFWHRDLHVGQILFGTTTRVFYLLDFGNSHLEYYEMEGIKTTITGSSGSIPRLMEVARLIEMFIDLAKKLPDSDDKKSFLGVAKKAKRAFTGAFAMWKVVDELRRL
eukprot:TRINITY_DN7148_c0_g1_i1.p1 TRINITY_DN7148_c0_g1~~TRINITY_DN7148_c0_g1_i1.p1  ORF type:complete len:375 (-),score=57.06 TRINITY_DN7148_c0_g1_i1:131-1216(-)